MRRLGDVVLDDGKLVMGDDFIGNFFWKGEDTVNENTRIYIVNC